MGFLIDLAWTAAGIAGLALSVWVIQLSFGAYPVGQAV